MLWILGARLAWPDPVRRWQRHRGLCQWLAAPHPRLARSRHPHHAQHFWSVQLLPAFVTLLLLDRNQPVVPARVMLVLRGVDAGCPCARIAWSNMRTEGAGCRACWARVRAALLSLFIVT